MEEFCLKGVDGRREGHVRGRRGRWESWGSWWWSVGLVNALFRAGQSQGTDDSDKRRVLS